MPPDCLINTAGRNRTHQLGSMNHTSCCPTSLYRIHFPLLCDAKLHNQKGRIKFYVDRLKDKEYDRCRFSRKRETPIHIQTAGRSIPITHSAAIYTPLYTAQEAVSESFRCCLLRYNIYMCVVPYGHQRPPLLSGYKHHSIGGHALLTPREAELLGSRSLDRHILNVSI